MSGRPALPPLELWGGIECTVNRVGDHYADQCRLTDHHDRATDLDQFASLGLSAIRYPLLWERIAPDQPDMCDFAWSDARMARLRTLGLRPIAGLVHHGSGPRYTSLIDPGFPEGLGRFAARVAERYDWIADWTPVNEPLTTARFSALYGHWYPHGRDERMFWLALLNQIDGIRLAMKAVRRVRPDARLIQTEDLGRTYATSLMQSQAAFDNERRWAGWDLLFGRITPDHVLWHRLVSLGFSERLRAIADDPCPPDVIGVNHYLTSDRFLDHRIERYPPHTHGGNFSERYADVEAVRVLDPAPSGLRLALSDAWERYRAPVALSEVHNGCTREEQLRWAAEAWDTALASRAAGANVCAVTAWALLGSQGWNTLLTGPGLYEPGVYDVRGGFPRPTALAALWAGLPSGEARHPVAAGAGWWRRPARLLHEPVRSGDEPPRWQDPRAVRPLLIVGATGTLGQAFARACRRRGIAFVLTDRAKLDLRRPASIAAALDRHQPWAVVNAGGWVRVDDAETDPDGCHDVNAAGAAALARACAIRDIACIGFSSDLVFDGRATAPYDEDSAAAPLGVYGRSKLAMERACTDLRGGLIVRTAAFFSSDDRHNFAIAVTDALAAGRSFGAACDHVVTPTFVPHLVDAVLDLTIDGETGLWHLTNGEAVSWADFARRIALACGLDASLVEDVPGRMLGWRAPRPAQAALVSRRGACLPALQFGIDGFAAARPPAAAWPARLSDRADDPCEALV